MGDDGEPHDDRTRDKISELVRMVQDRREPFLLPNKTMGEIAVCNPSAYDNHLIYRAREKWNNKYGERSVLKKDGETIIAPEHYYEKDGIEDGRLSKKGDTYLIVYAAFNEDKENGGAKIALATTKNFKREGIKKHGIIGPQVRLERGIELVGANSYYGKRWSKELEEIRKTYPNMNPFLQDKDATLEYMPQIKKWALWHRLEPAIQIAYANKISDFKSNEFWEDHIRNIEANTILKPSGYWAKEKIGLGGLPIMIDGRKIGHIHGVEKKEDDNLVQYFYRGTFVEFDPETNQVIAALRDPMLIPQEQDVLIEKDTDGKRIEKYVNFPTILKIDPSNPEVFLTIGGWGDEKIGQRTHSKYHILNGLSHPHNAIENWNKGILVA